MSKQLTPKQVRRILRTLPPIVKAIMRDRETFTNVQLFTAN